MADRKGRGNSPMMFIVFMLFLILVVLVFLSYQMEMMQSSIDMVTGTLGFNVMEGG